MTVKARKVEAPPRAAASARRPGSPPGLPGRLAPDDLAHAFDDIALEQGRALAASGAAEIEGFEGRRILGRVRHGRARQIASIDLLTTADRTLIQGRCTCQNRRCCHQAALAVAYLNANPHARRPVQGVLQIGERAEERPVIHYGLDLAEGDDGLYVTIGLVRRRGAQGRLEVSSPKRAHAVAAPGRAGEVDREICELLGNSSLPLVAIPLTQAELIEALIPALVRAKRCRWSSAGPRLVSGPDQRFLFEDGVRGEGRRYLNLPAAVRLIASDPAWYIDTDSGQIGQAELFEVSAEGFEAPRAGAAGLKRAEERVVIADEAPRPVVVAASGRPASPSDAGEPGAAAGVAASGCKVLLLHFDYRGRRVRERDQGQFVRADTPSGPVFVRRDRAAEERAADRLRALGLTTVKITIGQGHAGHGYAFRGADAEAAWAAFATVSAETLRAEGWKVELGDKLAYRVVEADDDWQVDVLEAANEWFSLDLGIMVEGERIPLLPVLLGILARGGAEAATAADGRVKALADDGRVLSLPADRVAAFLTTLSEMLSLGAVGDDGRLSLPNADAPRLAALEEVVGGRWHGGERLRDLGRRLRALDRIDRVTPPPIFHASLRAYQRDGLDWLQFLAAHGIAGILADDMGLGKTAQTLAHIAAEKHAGRLDQPCLVIVPTSLVPNWVAEAAKFVPSLTVVVLHGPTRHERKYQVANADLVVTTYAILARDSEYYIKNDWHMVVLDEAQAIKNPMAKSTRAACRLKARLRLCLTGTPIENHLGEVWSQFAFLMPGLLGSHRDFVTRFRVPIEKHGDTERRSLLARRLRPFILRRTKGEVAVDLPPKTEITNRIDLASDQRDLYETIRLSMHEKVRGEVDRHGIARSRIVILDALLKLRQVCCDPRLVKLSTARSVRGSGKLETLMEMLPGMIDAGRRILLFSQFTSMLDLIRAEAEAAGLPYLELRGDTLDRATPVERFQAGEVPLFLISLKAGGRGLNLTAADTVIHYDPWWNPAVEAQATDRAHRIGQDKPVFVYKLVAAGTVEDRIVDLQKRKGTLADAVLDEGSWVGSMADADLDYLFSADEMG